MQPILTLSGHNNVILFKALKRTRQIRWNGKIEENGWNQRRHALHNYNIVQRLDQRFSYHRSYLKIMKRRGEEDRVHFSQTTLLISFLDVSIFFPRICLLFDFFLFSLNYLFGRLHISFQALPSLFIFSFRLYLGMKYTFQKSLVLMAPCFL